MDDIWLRKIIIEATQEVCRFLYGYFSHLKDFPANKWSWVSEESETAIEQILEPLKNPEQVHSLAIEQKLQIVYQGENGAQIAIDNCKAPIRVATGSKCVFTLSKPQITPQKSMVIYSNFIVFGDRATAISSVKLKVIEKKRKTKKTQIKLEIAVITRQYGLANKKSLYLLDGDQAYFSDAETKSILYSIEFIKGTAKIYGSENTQQLQLNDGPVKLSFLPSTAYENKVLNVDFSIHKAIDDQTKVIVAAYDDHAAITIQDQDGQERETIRLTTEKAVIIGLAQVAIWACTCGTPMCNIKHRLSTENCLFTAVRGVLPIATNTLRETLYYSILNTVGFFTLPRVRLRHGQVLPEICRNKTCDNFRRSYDIEELDSYECCSYCKIQAHDEEWLILVDGGDPYYVKHWYCRCPECRNLYRIMTADLQANSNTTAIIKKYLGKSAMKNLAIKLCSNGKEEQAVVEQKLAGQQWDYRTVQQMLKVYLGDLYIEEKVNFDFARELGNNIIWCPNPHCPSRHDSPGASTLPQRLVLIWKKKATNEAFVNQDYQVINRF